MKKHRDPSASLEREVILAVVILYVGICAVMLGLHYAEPGGPATMTSSVSPSADAIAAAAPAGSQTQQRLEAASPEAAR